jgi:hypothetical protein
MVRIKLPKIKILSQVVDYLCEVEYKIKDNFVKCSVVFLLLFFFVVVFFTCVLIWAESQKRAIDVAIFPLNKMNEKVVTIDFVQISHVNRRDFKWTP